VRFSPAFHSTGEIYELEERLPGHRGPRPGRSGAGAKGTRNVTRAVPCANIQTPSAVEPGEAAGGPIVLRPSALRLHGQKRGQVVCQPTPTPRGVRSQRWQAAIDAR